MAFIESSLKRKQTENELNRKENLKLGFDKRSLEGDLASANRKISSLNNDIETIHNELNRFAENFETNLEAALKERDSRIADLNHKLQLKAEQYELLNISYSRLEKKSQASTDLLRLLSSTLEAMRDKLIRLESAGRQEESLKKLLVQDTNRRVEAASDVVQDQLEEYVECRLEGLVKEFASENDRLRKDKLHLEREVNDVRQEMKSMMLLFNLKQTEVDDAIPAPTDQPQAPANRAKLFTQGTLMLDIPNLLEDM